MAPARLGAVGDIPAPYSLSPVPCLLFPFLSISWAWVKKKSPKSPSEPQRLDLSRKGREPGGRRRETSPTIRPDCVTITANAPRCRKSRNGFRTLFHVSASIVAFGLRRRKCRQPVKPRGSHLLGGSLESSMTASVGGLNAVKRRGEAGSVVQSVRQSTPR